jgi:hypothetical protein
MNGNGADASSSITAGQVEKDFVEPLQDKTMASEPLEQFKTAEFSSTAFAVFALTSQVSEATLQDAAKAFNGQAQDELGFNDAEFAEMGDVANVPSSWQLHDRSPMGAAQWFVENFDKLGEGTVLEPQWFPFAFVGIASRDWRDNGVVVVAFKNHAQHREGGAFPMVAFVASPEKVSSMIVTLRERVDNVDNVRDDDELV